MNKRGYEQYEKTIAEFFEREGIDLLLDKPSEDTCCPECYSTNIRITLNDFYEISCRDCQHEYDPTSTEGCIEPYFSWYYCDVCQRPEGGDRYSMIGYSPATEQIQGYSVCVDCNYYVEYGQLDDMTMLDIERGTKDGNN